MAHTPEMLDALLKDCKTPEDVGALYTQLLQRVINRSLETEMDVHLVRGAEAHAPRANRRNGKLAKTVKGGFGEIEIHTPRDRDGSFDHARRCRRLWPRLFCRAGALFSWDVVWIEAGDSTAVT
jgi:transposase-like protein